jgi:hypothetical protein
MKKLFAAMVIVALSLGACNTNTKKTEMKDHECTTAAVKMQY